MVLLYLVAQRLNLGVVRQDENAWWSLAPHDIALACYLLGADPIAVSATGGVFLQRERAIEDVVFATLHFPDARLAHIHVSWLDPHKVRRVTVVGSRRMAVFDDMEPTEKIRIIDKGIDTTEHYESFHDAMQERIGDIRIPPVPLGEPLKVEAAHFLECVASRKTPRTCARNGIRVLQVIEAAEESIKKGGEAVAVKDYV